MADWEKSAYGLSAADFNNFLEVTTGGLLGIHTWTKRSRSALSEDEAAKNEEICQNVSFLHASTVG